MSISSLTTPDTHTSVVVIKLKRWGPTKESEERDRRAQEDLSRNILKESELENVNWRGRKLKQCLKRKMTRSSSPNSKINPEKLRICRHQTPWNQKGWTQEVRPKFRKSPTPGRCRPFPTCGDWTWRSPRKQKKTGSNPLVYKPYQHLQISASSC